MSGVDSTSLPSHTASKKKPPSKSTTRKRKRSERKRSSTSKASATGVGATAVASSSSIPVTTKPGNENSASVDDDDDEEEESTRKRGHQGNFRGARLKFLEASLPDYVKAKPKGPCFSRICADWFEKWPWHGNDTQPERFDVLDSQDATISDETRSQLTEEREKALETVQNAGKKQLERWFWRNVKKANSAVPLQLTPLAPLLRKALGFAGGAPRRSTLYKVWMKRPENKAKVQEVVQARVAEKPVEKPMLLKLRCEVAESLFEEEPEDVKNEIEERVEKVYEQQLELYMKITAGEPVSLEDLGEDRDADEIREICRESLTKFLQPLLDLLRLYTGLKFCLLGGAPPPTDDDDFFLLTINSGESAGVNPQTFQNWHNEYFTKNVMALFMLFLCNQNPKDVLGEPGLVHPDSSNTPATTTSKATSIADPSLIRMSEESDTATRNDNNKKQRKTSKATGKRKARRRVTEKDSEDDESSSNEEDIVLLDKNGKVIHLHEMSGRVIETRDEKVVEQHFFAESSPEPDRPLPDVLKSYLASMLTEARRDTLGMLNAQSGIVYDHNLDVLIRDAKAWKAKEDLRSLPTPNTGTVPSRTETESLGPMATASHSPSTLDPPQPLVPPRSLTTAKKPDRQSVNFRHGSVPLDNTETPNNVFQLEDHEIRLAASRQLTSTRGRNTVRFSSVPAHPVDTGKSDLFSFSALPVHSKTPLQSKDTPPSDPSANTKSTRARPKPRPLPQRARIVSSPSNETSPNETADTTSSTPTGPASNVTPSSAGNAGTSTDQVDLNDCPVWLNRAVAAFGGLEQPHTQWNKALSALVTLERSYDFRDPSGKGAAFSAAKGVRPPLVEWYFKNRKNVETTLKHHFDGLSVQTLGDDLGKWWSVINPEWRERDNQGRIVTGGDGEGTWDGIHKPGQCGMVTVLLCVRWWYLRVGDDSEQMEKCLLLLSDVGAVIEDMAYERGAYDKRLKRKEPASAVSNDPRPVRRTRVK
ncbi:hypothetical protein C8R42DRAFT_728485 [Lentinula raphanica]|nr:hypothetical protein C8R42DRAFT_728485 [Lentinula raphanica]